MGIAAICGTDAAEWDHGPVLTKPPVTLGHEFGGVVHEAGASAHVREGRRVVSGAGVWCGHCEWCRRGRTNLCAGYWTLGLSAAGGLAEYVRVPAKTLVAVPDDLSDRSAAIAQPFAVALHASALASLPGSRAVVGVGGIGAFIVAGAHARGVADLIAIDVDDGRLETARARRDANGERRRA